MLEDASQTVEVVMEATDSDYAPLGLAPVRFRWGFNDVDEDRSWTVFSGDPQMLPYYRYKVTVTVKGTLFRKGQTWTTQDWYTANGNGPLIVDVPPPDGDGVVTRSLTEDRVRRLRELAAPEHREAATDEVAYAAAPAAPQPRPVAAAPAEPAHEEREPRSALTSFLSYPL